MIQITCNDDIYTYNVYHLVKAFFPGEEVAQKVDRCQEEVLAVQFPNGAGLTIREEEFPAGAERKDKKYFVDCKLYETCKEHAGRELAWGILTGVRPTKLAMQKIQEGMEKEPFVNWFRKDSFVSEEKGRLAYEIARREAALLEKLDYRDGYSLYVGIPFCPSVCSYCSFSSGAISEWEGYVEEYLAALKKELSYIGEQAALKQKKLNTIYIGGGTPTTLSEEQLEGLLTHIDCCFSREHLLEYTVEAGRPDSITKGKLEVLRNHQITRISINPQTMQQKTLDVIGRRHTVEEVKEIFHLARTLGFDNINMDLIAGLPGERPEDMKDTLRQIQELAPDSLTVHALAIKRAAKMGQEKTVTGKVALLPDDPEKTARDLSVMIEDAMRAAREMELQPYYLYRQKNIAGNFENVGYAKVDKAGIYNILIMEEKQSIIAAGAGSSTKIVLDEPIEVPGSRHHRKTTLVRTENVKDIKEYIARIDEMIERKGEWLWH